MSSSFQPGSVETRPYVDPTPLPDDIPKVAELGVTSGPLKSAAFFIGAYCKEFNGLFFDFLTMVGINIVIHVEDFMLCKAEDRDPAHCLKEGRRVTRCATDLYVLACSLLLFPDVHMLHRITKMRENCLSQFSEHWNCLERNNQVCLSLSVILPEF